MLETFVGINKYINKVSNELEINFENAINSFLSEDKEKCLYLI